MSNIATIYNENKLLEKKINFFNDYFSFYAHYAGIFFETEIENPLSLVEKIIFQLEHNPKMGKACIYINNYLEHPFFTDNNFLSSFESFKILLEEINAFKLEENKAKYVEDHETFLIKLKNVKAELSELMYQKAFERMLQMMTCKDELKEHEKEIKYLTKILVTEPLFKGRSKHEVQSVFLEILSNDIKKFPFPKTIISEEQRSEYLKTLNFPKQFHGIINFLDQEPVNKFLICKIFGASLSDDSILNYNRVEFFGSNNSKIKLLKLNLEKGSKEITEMFFAGNNYLLAAIPIRVYKEEIVVENVLPELQDATVYLEIILDKFLFIDHESYVITTNFLNGGVKSNTRNGVKEVKKKEIEKFNDNPYSFLASYRSPAKDYLLQNERVFIDAAHYNNLEGFWRYLENLFIDNPKYIIETVAELIISNENFIRKNKLTHYLFQNTLPWSFDYHRFGIDGPDFVLLTNELQKSETQRFFERMDYPFFHEIKNMFSVHSPTTLKDYYVRILRELYEVRNTIAHQNLIQGKAKIKLQHSIPEIVSRFRWVLFEYIRKYPDLDFKAIITKAKKDCEVI